MPKAALPPGVDVLVAVAAETVRGFGSAQVCGVPPEHLEELRSAIRRHLRAQGLRSRTYRHRGSLYVVSDDARNAIDPKVRRARERAIADAVAMDLTGAVPIGRTTPRDAVRWGDWVTGRR